MPTNLPDHELLRRYLTGAITAPEEADLERRARTDETLAAALAGLQARPEADHAARVRNMLKRARPVASQQQGARPQVPTGDKKAKVVPAGGRAYVRYAAAAAVLLLIAASLFLLPDLLNPTASEDLAVSTPPPPTATTPRPRVNTVDDQDPERPATKAAVQNEATPVAAPEPEVRQPTARPEPITRSAPVPTPAPARPNGTPREESGAAPPVPPAPTAPATNREAPPVTEESAEEDMMTDEMIEDVPVGEASRRKQTAPPPPSPLRRDALNAPLPQTAPTDAAARRGSYVEGIVTNENGVPIANAELYVPGLPLGERTDSNGFFRLPATAMSSLVTVSHPDYETDEVEVSPRSNDLQISLDRRPYERPRPELYDPSPGVTIKLDNELPSFAQPTEGFANLRRRLEEDAPADLPRGRYKFSFTVNTDGTLTGFEFRGRPERAVMDYLGTAMVQTSEWKIVHGEEPVRIYFKVVLK